MLHLWGQTIVTHARHILAIGIPLLLLAAIHASGVFGTLTHGGFITPDSQSARELGVEHMVFGSHGDDVVAIYSSRQHKATDAAFKAQVQQVIAGLPEDTIDSIESYYASGDPRLLSADRHATRVILSLAGTDEDGIAQSYRTIKDKLQAEHLETDIAGIWAVYIDLDELVSRDLARAETYSLPIVLLLSLVIFGSLVAAAMPVVVGATAVIGALAIVRVLTLFTDISVFSVNIITLLGMGLAVDYALFIVSRFREELNSLPADHADPAATAIINTLSTAGHTILFSGLTVAAALTSLLVFPHEFFKSMGYGGIAAVLVAMLASLTLLPALLRLLGPRIDAGRVPARLIPWRCRTDSVNTGWWFRMAHRVMRRPLLHVVVIVAALLTLGSPFVGVQWGGIDTWVLPQDAPAHIAADKLERKFDGPTSSADIVLYSTDRQRVLGYMLAVRDLDGIRDVEIIAQEQRARMTLLRATWHGKAQSRQSRQLVADIRAIQPRQETTVLVGGQTAMTVDLLDSIAANLPWMGLIVVGVMMVLLFLAFGSAILPVKAILVSLISISASFGMVAWVFAEGHLETLLNFRAPGYLDASQPILMLAVLFGLSMDYEVFLLSRVREAYDRTGDNDYAVAAGLQHTGGIITSAALLLAVVIGAFGMSDIVFMKMIGMGMLVALLLDATIVRALLVPATMKLLGRLNWWAPGPMARWWRNNGFYRTDDAR